MTPWNELAMISRISHERRVGPVVVSYRHVAPEDRSCRLAHFDGFDANVGELPSRHG